MKTICVVTATRAEFGLLLPVIKKLKAVKQINCRVVVTGAHLSQEFGLTKNEILAEGIEISREIDILMSGDSPSAVSKSMGIALISFADYFKEFRPDALLVLGDRYELVPICCVAMNEQVPIIHMYGGDKSEGAIDEAYRHMITKMSCLHFTATEQNRKRVIQLGEAPDRVFFVGSTGVENILHTDFLEKETLEKQIGFRLGEHYAVATFHPATLEQEAPEQQIMPLLEAVCLCKEINFLFTKSNADAGGREINALIAEYRDRTDNLFLLDSMGAQKYLSAVRYADFVIGNSSSGIAEAPAMGVPSINIGSRQRGRMKPESVMDCDLETNEICAAIQKAMSDDFRKNLSNSLLYGDGNSSQRIVDTIAAFLSGNHFDARKKFFDIAFDVMA